MKTAARGIALILFIQLCSGRIYASHVLPYPSYMPGSTLYRISRFLDSAKQYWYFGDIAQFRYHLGLSDKYLVEAKTLFEYKQYLLAADALDRSDKQFAQIPAYVHAAAASGKDVAVIRRTVVDAAITHAGLLRQIKRGIPERVTWTPEKEAPTELPLWERVAVSEEVRVKSASAAGQL